MSLEKAIDDRFGCFLMIKLIKDLREGRIFSSNNLLFLFTVREELLQKGLPNNIKEWHIDLMIALDAINAHECFSNCKSNIRFIEKGPVLILYNRSGLTDPELNHYIQSLAHQHKIPLQLGLQPKTDTDVHRIQSLIPAPAIILSIVVKNVHTAFSIASLDMVISM